MALSRFTLSTCLLASGLFISPLLAQTQPTPTDDEQQPVQKQQVVVTATRIDTPQSQVGSSVTVIDAQQIEQRQDQNITDILKHVPGVHVRQSGVPGSPTSIFIRGAGSSHTLLLLDGIKLHDVAASRSIASFNHLSAGSLERVEVLRGPQSARYGTEAIGGVISATTKRGNGPINGYYSIEAGSYQTASQQLYVGGGEETFNYAVSLDRVDSTSFSSLDSDSENDPYRNSGFHTRIGTMPLDNMKMDVVFHYITSDLELDETSFFGLYDTQTYQTKSKQLAFKVDPTFYLFDGQVESKLALSYYDSDRKTYDNTYPANRFIGRSTELDWQNTVYLTEENTLLLGISYTNEEALTQQYNAYAFPTPTYDSAEYANHYTNLYAQDQWTLFENFTITAGLRYIEHEDFGDKLTYQFSGAYHYAPTQTIFRASVGTGFKAPALDDLFNTVYSSNNPNLKPEQSLGWDFGVEQSLLNDKLTVGATFFRNNIKNMISFDNTFKLNNVDRAQTQGVEASISFNPTENLVTSFNYTYTDTQDMSDGSRLLRRPLHTYSFDITQYFMAKKAQITVSLLGESTRDDIDETGSFSPADAYVVVDVSGSYKITKNIEVFGRIENLFNQQYQSIRTYNDPDASAYAGVKVSF